MAITPIAAACRPTAVQSDAVLRLVATVSREGEGDELQIAGWLSCATRASTRCSSPSGTAACAFSSRSTSSSRVSNSIVSVPSSLRIVISFSLQQSSSTRGDCFTSTRRPSFLQLCTCAHKPRPHGTLGHSHQIANLTRVQLFECGEPQRVAQIVRQFGDELMQQFALVVFCGCRLRRRTRVRKP